MQLLGLIRFAYLIEGGFKVRRAGEEGTFEHVFDPERLRQRFATLEHIVLPGLRAQTDQDFKVALLTSTELPAPFLQRLATLVADIPTITLVAVPPMPQKEAASSALDPLKDMTQDYIGHFRLDDDDAVAIDFVAHTKSVFSKMRDLVGTRATLDYSHGVLLNAEQNELCFQKLLKRQWTPAQVIFLRSKNPRNIISFPHHRLDTVMTSVTQPDPLMFVRTINGFNASGDFNKLSASNFSAFSDEDVELLYDRFRISLSAFQSAYFDRSSAAA